jgi:OmpA-OmpF porin, OOP family
MATTLVDDLSGMFRTQALGDAASALHESEGSVMRGFQTAAAAILGKLSGKSTEPGFMRQAFDMISGENKILDGGLGSLFRTTDQGANNSIGSRFLSMLFGGEQSGITDKISQVSGLRLDSASRLLSFAAPVVLGLLGKRVRDGHMNAGNLSNLLQTERSGIAGFLPSGLTGLLSSPVAAASQVVAAVPKPAVGRWLWPVALLLGLFALVWGLGRLRQPAADAANRAVSGVQTAAATAVNGVQSAASGVANMVRTTLANGIQLNIPSIGMENRLLEYLKTPNLRVDPNRWFEFDRLLFDTNGTALRPESQEQLSNIAAILKAYPNVQVKIGGYTDSTGDESANQALSEARADTVRRQLVEMGIDSSRLQAEGYGSKYPVADNSTEEGRARNRRIALQVTQA